MKQNEMAAIMRRCAAKVGQVRGEYGYLKQDGIWYYFDFRNGKQIVIICEEDEEPCHKDL